VIAADEEDEAADGVGGVARVVLEGGEGFVVSVDLVLLEGGDEVVEGLDWEMPSHDGGLQGNVDGVARGGWLGKALMEHGAPGGEEARGGCGVGYFIAEVVRGATKGVDAVESAGEERWEGRRSRRGSSRSAWWSDSCTRR
jgi:hypothetical protein